MENSADSLYVFGYGSLIWRPDFAFDAVHKVVVSGYARRFWQASHDHRGTASRPGRVLTLVPEAKGSCEGLLYALPASGRADILRALDKREQDGYQRAWLPVSRGGELPTVSALTWLAAAGNPSWVGDEPMSELVEVIAGSHGPSGSNRDYLVHLHKSLITLGIVDQYIARLVARVQAI